jgi:hypothetical protein
MGWGGGGSEWEGVGGKRTCSIQSECRASAERVQSECRASAERVQSECNAVRAAYLSRMHRCPPQTAYR